MSFAFRMVLFFGLVIAAGCSPATDALDDHTLPTLANVDDFNRLAETSSTRHVVKFVVAPFYDASPQTIYMDSNFYTLHDEWYWFRLLNGERVPGETVEPVKGLHFTTIAEIYAWAEKQLRLPLDLTYVSDGEARLYSTRFYQLALSPPRIYGLGTLMRTTNTKTPYWVFELEYSDPVEHEQLVRFFEALERSLPEEISRDLRWVVRSPGQERLAETMEAEALRYHDRILRYTDLVVPGEIEVYSPGLTAGRLKMIRSGQPIDSYNDEIVVLEDLPDWLPQGAGLITAVPQTPLAHVNVLARNRGIPNVYLGGALQDPLLDQLDRGYAPVAVYAQLPDQLQVVALTRAQYDNWLLMRQKSPIAVTAPAADSLEYTLDLAKVALSEVGKLRPAIGGKNAGMAALVNTAGVATPDTPLAISIRPYLEHIEPLSATIDAMLNFPEFRSNSAVRRLLLEGSTSYRAHHRSAADQQVLDNLLAKNAAGTPLGDLLRGGGLQQRILDQPIAPATLKLLEDTLKTQFAALAPTQGLRFRSSSNVEDIEGFNGAGLYSSYTGFLFPDKQSSTKDRERSVAWALKMTWASYWGFEAFEERRLELVDHRSGAMGVLVHPRFDDDQELTNGVFTLTLRRGTRQGITPAIYAELALNVQKGAESVTNPTQAGTLPEVDRVELTAVGQLAKVVRVSRSTLSPEAVLLDDAALQALFEQAKTVAEAWLDAENLALDPAQRRDTLVLDFEFRQMAAGWPALNSGSRPQRMIIKQVRSLDPGFRAASPELLSAPIPGDLLVRARKIVRNICTNAELKFEVLMVQSDALLTPDLGFSEQPFVASVTATALAPIPALNLQQDQTLGIDHTQLLSASAQLVPESWRVDVSGQPSAELVSFKLDSSGAVSIKTQSASYSADKLSCTIALLHSAPADYLLSIIKASASGN
ncbi:MAG: hypothetical protein H6707_21170 [Deltaproteobacteria bacterium]|nr:hypothetical protein [Deltaproteobacteria bacterium]